MIHRMPSKFSLPMSLLDHLTAILDSANIGVWHQHVPSEKVVRNEGLLTPKGILLEGNLIRLEICNRDTATRTDLPAPSILC
jgi:hypothetical protein